jgi:hypothetical protein
MVSVLASSAVNRGFEHRSDQTVKTLNFCIFSAISWREQVTIQWDDDEVRFELSQHAYVRSWMFIVLVHWNNSHENRKSKRGWLFRVTSACGLMHLISIMSDSNLNLCQLLKDLCFRLCYSASSLKQQSAGRHVAPPISLMLCAQRRSNKYQCYSLRFDLIGARKIQLT